MSPGSVVITTDTGQAGTLDSISGEVAFVLLRNGDFWQGSIRMLREPQSPEDLENAVVDVERLEPKRNKKR